MNAAPPEFSIVVPVFDEGEAAPKLAREIAAAFAGEAYEMIFVDDASRDDTKARLVALKAEIPQLRVLGHRKNSGQSRAVRSGVLAARAPIVVTLDGDGQNDPADAPRLAKALQSGPETLTLNVPDAEMSDRYVKVSFFGAIDFGRYAAPDMTEDGVLQVASLDDLMATKLKVLMQRVEAKDYQDIAAMLNAGSDLSLGLAVAKEMFGNTFQPSESLKAMTWFEGGDLQRLTDDEKRYIEGVKVQTVKCESPSAAAEKKN